MFHLLRHKLKNSAFYKEIKSHEACIDSKVLPTGVKRQFDPDCCMLIYY